MPQSGPGLAPDPVRKTIAIAADDRITWNARPVSELELGATLARVASLDPEPELLLEPEAQASYDLTAQVLNIIKGSGVTKFGFVGNERYREFGAGGPRNPTRR